METWLVGGASIALILVSLSLFALTTPVWLRALREARCRPHDWEELIQFTRTETVVDENGGEAQAPARITRLFRCSRCGAGRTYRVK